MMVEKGTILSVSQGLGILTNSGEVEVKAKVAYCAISANHYRSSLSSDVVASLLDDVT